MTPILSPEQIKGIKEREERATKEPWEQCGCRFSIVSSNLNSQEILDICDTKIADYMSIEQAEINAHFIAHSRTDIPALLADREALVRRLKEAIAALKDHAPDSSMGSALTEKLEEGLNK